MHSFITFLCYFAVLRSNAQDDQQEQARPKHSTTAAAAHDNVAFVTADGAQPTRKDNIVRSGRVSEEDKENKHSAIEMEEINLDDDDGKTKQQQQQQQQQPGVQVEVGQTQDENGNVKYTFKVS